MDRCFPEQSAIKRLRFVIKRDNAEMTGNENVTADETDLVNELIKLKNRVTKIPRNLQEARSDFAVRQKTGKRVAMLRMRF